LGRGVLITAWFAGLPLLNGANLDFLVCVVERGSRGGE